jgi:hypothetical protein
VPARSNPFQRLIFRIHEQLAAMALPCTVQQSAMTAEPSSGSERETDVCIVTGVPNLGLKWAIECRDHSRPQSISWIDELLGKYVDLDYDKVVAVSSSGFTRAALAKAKKHDIECRTFEEAVGTDWPSEFVKIGLAFVESTMSAPTMRFRLSPPLQSETSADDVIVSTDGAVGTFAELQAEMEQGVLKNLERAFKERRASIFRTLADLEKVCLIEGERPLRGLWLVRDGVRHEISLLTYSTTVSTVTRKAPVAHRTYPGALVSTVAASENHGTPGLVIVQTEDHRARLFTDQVQAPAVVISVDVPPDKNEPA